jgi:Bacterial PH domain
VQQRQYQIPTRLRAFSAVAGAFVVVTGVIAVPVAASQLQQGGMPGVVVGSVLILAGALFITLALRPDTLTVDDGGLHLRTLTRARAIPWSLVRLFRARPGGKGWWFVWVELGTGKKVVLPGAQGSRGRAERITTELMAAHREHLVERSETT